MLPSLLAFLSHIINNPLRFPQSLGSDRKKLAVFFFSLCMHVSACPLEHSAHGGNSQMHCIISGKRPY